ncbi:MAG: universal stress protein [Methanomicrobiaceae archaeon]|nr:universal stress protein [Methanomicrobiaceae archaeon]
MLPAGLFVNRAESQHEIEVSVAEAQSRLEDMKKEFIARDSDATHHIRVGDPTEMILSVANEDDVSLIAMSAHGADWLREMLLESTTFTVVQRTKKPVLILMTWQETRKKPKERQLQEITDRLRDTPSPTGRQEMLS